MGFRPADGTATCEFLPKAKGDKDVGDQRDVHRTTRRDHAAGIAVFVAAIWIVTSGGWFDRTQQPAIQPTPTPEPSLIAPGTYLIDLTVPVEGDRDRGVPEVRLYGLGMPAPSDQECRAGVAEVVDSQVFGKTRVAQT